MRREWHGPKSLGEVLDTGPVVELEIEMDLLGEGRVGPPWGDVDRGALERQQRARPVVAGDHHPFERVFDDVLHSQNGAVEASEATGAETVDDDAPQDAAASLRARVDTERVSYGILVDAERAGIVEQPGPGL